MKESSESKTGITFPVLVPERNLLLLKKKISVGGSWWADILWLQNWIN